MADRQQRARDLESFEQLARGLGGTRYKEYDIAPYCEMVQASVPGDLWSSVFYSWSSLKGHLQGLHGLQRTEMFAARPQNEEDAVFACFLTIWESADALAEWLQHGYPIEKMLTGLGVSEDRIELKLIRDYS